MKASNNFRACEQQPLSADLSGRPEDKFSGLFVFSLMRPFGAHFSIGRIPPTKL